MLFGMYTCTHEEYDPTAKADHLDARSTDLSDFV